jgi:hypothetical protein
MKIGDLEKSEKKSIRDKNKPEILGNTPHSPFLLIKTRNYLLSTGELLRKN